MKFNYLFISILFIVFSAAAQEGTFTTYYSSGAVESEVIYKNNVREGEAKFYYENGNLKEERMYINGKVEGLVKTYYENGTVKEILNIQNGKREGITSVFSEAGEFVADMEFSEGKRIMPEPVEEILIAADNTDVEIKTEPVIRKQNNNIKKTEVLEVPPSLEDTMEDDPAFFSTAEVMPQPSGGMNAIYKRLVYPREAKAKQIQGTVKVLVYINEFGDVIQAEVVEGLGYGCDEAARTTLYYTKFAPGLIRGKPVKMRIIIPVEFKLNT